MDSAENDMISTAIVLIKKTDRYLKQSSDKLHGIV